MLPRFRLAPGRTAQGRSSAIVLAILLAVFRLFLSGDTDHSSAVAGKMTYLPTVISGSLPQVDLTITALEASQSIQTSDNTVPLVASRPTVVRVYARTVDGEAPVSATVLLSATRDGEPLGTVTVGPQLVPLAPTRADYGGTFNARLPAGWLRGKVEVVARVDAANAVAETNEGNNTAVLTLTFNDVPPLAVKIVPVNYTHLGATGTGVYPGQRSDPVSDWLMRAFPVSEINVTYHPGYDFTGDLSLSSEWVRLLVEVTMLRASDGAPEAQAYYALVPTRHDANRWFYAGIAGMGWLGHRVAVGLDLNSPDRTGSLAGHEIGHNLGRSHAPCGTPATVDATYPYASASIGEYGLDVASNTLLSPAATVDMMSYCRPKWVSDYTYVALYDAQRAAGLATAGRPIQSLLIQAQFDAAGRPWLQPVYTFPQIATPPASGSDYTVELLDATGAIVATHPVAVLEAAEPGVSARLIQASVPLPAGPVTRIRLRQAGIAVAERTLTVPPASSRPIVSARRTAGAITLRWGSPETPAIVRYTADDGHTWITLAVNHRGGQLTLDSATLPAPAGRFQIIPADTTMPIALTVELDP